MTGPTEEQRTDDPLVITLPRESAPTVNLDVKEKEVGNAAESKARVFGLYGDTWARLLMVGVIAVIFVGLNYGVMHLVRDVFDSDIRFLAEKPPTIKATERVVTTQLLMSLIGATVVQVGVALIAIVSYLFPKAKHDGGAPGAGG